MPFFRKALTAAAATGVALVCAAVPAQAAPSAPSGSGAYGAQNLDHLSPAARLVVERTQLVAKVTTTTEGMQPQDATARASAAKGGTLSPMLSGCWTQRWTGKATALAGNTLYTYYTVGGWCSSGSTVTQAWLADAGGETSTPGWRYEGVIHTGSGVVSNQGRSYSQHHFVLGVGGWDVQSPTPCMRVKGLSAGYSNGDYTCGIY